MFYPKIDMKNLKYKSSGSSWNDFGSRDRAISVPVPVYYFGIVVGCLICLSTADDILSRQ